MNPPAQNQPRLLPFDRESPGSWQKWEDFWVDFLSANPLLPWPGKPFRFKRSIASKKWGVAGGAQDGIDMRADMEDGTVLAIQCKDWKDHDATKVKKAMDKAETEFKKAQAYFMVFTAKEIPKQIQDEADRRGNWEVIGRDTLSSWFFVGKFLDVEAQKRLVERHFGTAWLKSLFPQPWDELLIPLSQFFNSKNLIHHDAQLQGQEFKDLAETLATALGEGNPRITILSAPGGQGKTRLLKATAELVESRFPNRKVRFHNDSAGADAEDYGVRGADFKDLCLFIDDAHRLENVRKRLLRMVAESGTASVLIAARPNNIRALETRLEECGFTESDWQKFEVPTLDRAGRRALAVEILGNDDARTPDFLAEESERCPLICTVGAELIRSGGIGPNILKSADFRRRVFDRLMESSLDHLFSGDPEYRKTSELCLRAIALLAPIKKSDELAEFLARVTDRKSIDVDPIVSRLEEAGLLRAARGSLRVVPDLLSDHLVYDTAYGSGRIPSLVRNLIENPRDSGLTLFFANLAEAEWRARQEGKKDAFLASMWNSFREMLRDPEDQRIFGLLDTWRKVAIFQPERTLELARILLGHETARVAAGIAERWHNGFRYDSISMYLGKLPDLLAPVATHHRNHRMETFDLLWEIGCVKDGPKQSQDELPAAWQTIARTASLAHWEKGGPQDTFEWLKSWARQSNCRAMLEEGRPHLSEVSREWFESNHNYRWREIEPTQAIYSEISEFRHKVLSWIETEIIPLGVRPTWSVRHVIFAAGCLRSETITGEKRTISSLANQSLEALRNVLSLYDDPVLRLSVWQHLSKRAALDDQDELKSDLLALRNSICHDLPFQLVRLASSYAFHEWNHERLQVWKNTKDFDEGKAWWYDLAAQTINELRRLKPIRETFLMFDQADSSLVIFRQRASWDILAEAWARQCPEERNAVMNEMMEQPEHPLVPCFGYFLGLRDEIDCEHAENFALRALSHKDDRVRRAALHRLSWSDVKRSELISKRLHEMSSSDDFVIASAIVSFISWNQYGATPYFDEVLSALNVNVLSTSELVRVAEAVANLMEYTEHTISPDLLALFFQRLEEEEDLNKVFPDHVLSVFQKKFPMEMFRVHLTRIREGKFLPWMLDDWFLSELPEQLSLPEFERTARDLLDETIQANDDHFFPLSKLFDVSVARVQPKLAAQLLAEALRKRPQEAQTMNRIVNLTGAGNGSVVYHAPDFTKELLTEIDLLPAFEARGLRSALVFRAGPRVLGWTDGELDEKYLWARNQAARLAEEHRADILLRDFFLEIVRHQAAEATRIRHLADED